MELLIKNVRIVDFSQDYMGDIYIKNGKIAEIGENLNKSCSVIEGKGKLLMPAFVDLHCHFRDPGLTYKEDIVTGSRAAVRGGYTTVNLMGNTKPICSSMEVVNYVKDKARETGLIDVNQVVSITRNFDGITTEHLKEIDKSVKFLSDDGKGVEDSKVLLEAMNIAQKMGFGIMSHCEDPKLINSSSRLAENMMTWRDITLSKFTGCRLHLSHVSTKEAIKDIVEAKKEGAPITCEVTPHHLALTGEETYRVNPPIREEDDRLALIKAIKDGYVDAIATDHAPHTEEDKKKGSPGLVGLETSFAICYTYLVKKGHISINRLSEVMSKTPAEILGLNKGKISLGYSGDLVLVDTDNEFTIKAEEFYSKGKNTPFDRMKVYGQILITIKAGRVVYSNPVFDL